LKNGTIRQKALRGLSGKAGSIIGSSWTDIGYIKGQPKILTNKHHNNKGNVVNYESRP